MSDGFCDGGARCGRGLTHYTNSLKNWLAYHPTTDADCARQFMEYEAVSGVSQVLWSTLCRVTTYRVSPWRVPTGDPNDSRR